MSDFCCDESVLDARQLVHTYIGCDSASTDSVVTSVSNEKLIAPPPEENEDEAEREKNVVSERLSHLGSALSQPRLVQRSSVSEAVLDPTSGLSTVTKQRGRQWQFVGHARDKKLVLFPEEALFMVETAHLILSASDVALSVQQAYSFLVGDEPQQCSLNNYRVYSTLVRNGYTVRRHRARESEKPACSTETSASREDSQKVEPLDCTEPLLDPKESFDSTSQVLERLRGHFGSDSSSRSSGVSIAYDIFAPSKTFSKTNPCAPDYRVCVVSSASPVPTTGLNDDDEVPLVVAVVSANSAATISFFSMSEVQLPILT